MTARPGPGVLAAGVITMKYGHFRWKTKAGIIFSMHDIPNRIADVLLEVEANLRISGMWDAYQPAQEALVSSQPFCFDTLRFEQWLQWIFLPRMKQILEHSKPLPSKSSIFVYAQETLHKYDPPAANLLTLIKRFDDLIAIQSAARHH